MVYENDPPAEYGIVERVRGVVCLVVVHCYAGCEKNGGDPVVDERPLVGEPVEQLREVLAPVI